MKHKIKQQQKKSLKQIQDKYKIKSFSHIVTILNEKNIYKISITCGYKYIDRTIERYTISTKLDLCFIELYFLLLWYILKNT